MRLAQEFAGSGVPGGISEQRQGWRGARPVQGWTVNCGGESPPGAPEPRHPINQSYKEGLSDGTEETPRSVDTGQVPSASPASRWDGHTPDI